MAADHVIALGRVVSGHGVRGLARVKPFNPGSPAIEAAQHVLLVDRSGRRKEFAICECRPHGNVYLVGFAGIDSLNALEPWIGADLEIPAGELPAPDEDAVYHHEVLGIEVRTPDGRRVGTLVEVTAMPANDLWVVRSDPDESGAVREHLVPAVAPILSSSDLRARVAVIDPPPGLLEP